MSVLTVEVATSFDGFPGTAVPYVSADCQWRANEPGTGTVTVPNDAAIASSLTFGAWLRFYDGSEIAATVRIESLSCQVIDDGEERSQVLTASGIGGLGLLGDGIVYPASAGGAQPGRVPFTATRWFGAMRYDYNDAVWADLVEQWQVGIFGTPVPTAGRVPINSDPHAYQDPLGYYLYGDAYAEDRDAGRCYFRATFNVDAPEDFWMACRLEAAFDDGGELWVDEIKVIDVKQLSAVGNYQTPSVARLDLDDAPHVIFGFVDNYQRGSFNVAGVAASLLEVTSEGYGDIVWRLDDGDLCLLDPADEPGESLGTVGLVLLFEWEERGGPAWAASFDEDVDSDGNAWSVGTYSFGVGTTILDAWIGELVATGTYHVTCPPDELRVDVWSETTPSGTSYTAGVDITELTSDIAGTRSLR